MKPLLTSSALVELAFPIVMANDMLKRVRELFDAEKEKGIIMTSTYRSGINIKFGQANYDLLGQTTYNTSDGVDWTKGAIMFDFPTYKPTSGDGGRFNEPFCEFVLDADCLGLPTFILRNDGYAGC